VAGGRAPAELASASSPALTVSDIHFRTAVFVSGEKER
jgi:hypothetical protein